MLATQPIKLISPANLCCPSHVVWQFFTWWWPLPKESSVCFTVNFWYDEYRISQKKCFRALTRPADHLDFHSLNFEIVGHFKILPELPLPRGKYVLYFSTAGVSKPGRQKGSSRNALNHFSIRFLFYLFTNRTQKKL